MAASTIVKFVHEKSTKNTERFAEVVPDGGAAKVGSLYVQKSAFQALGSPGAITVTIEATS